MASVMTIGERPSRTMPSAIGEAEGQADRQHQRERVEQRRVGAADQPGQQDAGEADRPGHRQVEAAGQDDGALAQRQDGQERGQHEQRVEVAGIGQRVAVARLGDDEHDDEADVGRQRIAQRLARGAPAKRAAPRRAAAPAGRRETAGPRARLRRGKRAVAAGAQRWARPRRR